MQGPLSYFMLALAILFFLLQAVGVKARIHLMALGLACMALSTFLWR